MHCNRKAYFLVSATFRFQKGIEKNVHTPETYFKYQSYVPGSRNSLVSSVLAYWNWCPGQISLIKRNTKKYFFVDFLSPDIWQMRVNQIAMKSFSKICRS